MCYFCTLRTDRRVVHKRTLKKNTKNKSKNKDNDSNEDGDSETVIGKASPKKKHSLHFLWGIRKIYMQRKVDTTYRMSSVAHECLDAETQMYVCEYCE